MSTLTRARMSSAASMPEWGARAATVLYAAVAAGVAGHLVLGYPSYAAIGAAGLAVTAALVWWPRRRGVLVPVELELLLLWGVVTDNTVGRLMGLYERLWWYDKALHLVSPLLAAVVLSLLAHGLHEGQVARSRRGFDGVVIVLVVLGVGVLWELAEYGVDAVFGRGAQTSQHLAAIDDTMWDFIANATGSVLGVVVAFAWLARHRPGPRRRAFAGLARGGLAQGS